MEKRGSIMNSTSHAILARMRTALTGADRPPAGHHDDPRQRSVQDGLVDLFVERLEEHRATVHRCAPDDVERVLADVLGDREVVVPDGFPWAVPRPVPHPDRTGPVQAVATTVTLGVATAGAMVVTHGELTHSGGSGGGSRPLDPEEYVCVLIADQVMPGVPEAIAALDPRWPQLWISGASDGDIEMDRIEGIHGPRSLHVLVVSRP
jgi:L-lactate dehydrogenase complex protein LldG